MEWNRSVTIPLAHAQCVHRLGIGLKMNVAQGADMRKDAIFRIASMTKANVRDPSDHDRQLLTHTSGVGYSWSDPALAPVEKLTGKTTEPDLPVLHEPGEKWTYGAGTRVLGDVVAKMSGQPIEHFWKAGSSVH